MRLIPSPVNSPSLNTFTYAQIIPPAGLLESDPDSPTLEVDLSPTLTGAVDGETEMGPEEPDPIFS